MVDSCFFKTSQNFYEELASGETVELQGSRGKDYFRVRQILVDTNSHAITLRGHLFKDATCLNGLLSNEAQGLLNELVLFVDIHQASHASDPLKYASVSINLSQVLRKMELILTNLAFPNLSSWLSEQYCQNQYLFDLSDVEENDIAANAVLVCRWCYILLFERV